MEATEILRPGGSLSASEPGGSLRTARFGAGRVCAFDGCTTVLSSYNPAECCWTHTEPRPKIALGRRPAEPEGPRVLSGSEEVGLIRSIVGGRGTRVQRPARHPEPAPEPAPAPPAPPQPQPQPVPLS
jgi:hypothetical protein